jgi:hypothetical protein
MAELVETLADTETPRNYYDVVRDDNGTKFVVRNGDNMGAEAFVTVVRTQDGWVATDPRVPARDISGRILYNGPDRGMAEMRAINRMTGADGGQNPVTPDDESLTPSNAPANPDAIPNYDMLGLLNRRNVALALERVISPDLQVSLDDGDPNDPRVRVRSQGRFVGAIRQLENGQYKAYYNDDNAQVTEQDFDRLQDAIDFMKNGLAREFPVQPNNAPETPANNDNFRQERLGGRLYTFQTDSDGNINVGDGNGNNLFRVKRESEAPGGGQVDWYQPLDANGNAIRGVRGAFTQEAALQNLRNHLENRGNPSETPDQEPPQATFMRIGGKDFLHSRRADGSSEYYYNDNEVGRIERNANGGYDSVDVFSGDVTSFNSEADAMTHQEALLDAYAFNGMFDSNDPPSEDGGDSSGGPSTPPPSGPDGGNGGTPPAPSTPPMAPANPATPPAPRRIVVGQDSEGYDTNDPNDMISKQLGLPPGSSYQWPIQQYGGTWQTGNGWVFEGPNGPGRPATRAEALAFGYDLGTDELSPPLFDPANLPPIPDNIPIPGRLPEPRQPLIPTDANGNPILPGANPATPGSQAPGGPQDPSVPQAPQAPDGPEPLQPGRVIPAGRPRVNNVQPGDRRLNFNPGRDGKYWDVIDRKTRQVIGRARDREVAEQMALGLRDADGKLIDFNTPVPVNPRGPAKFPRPKGYKRTYIGRRQGYYIENPNDPNAPVVRATFDKDSNEWVGKLYANKQDAEAERNPIGEEVRDAGPVKFDGKANETLQKELDRLNPPAPAPEAQPAEPEQTQHTRTDFGSSVFAVHDGDNEYGVAKKGQDGKWSVNVFPTPADGNDASKSFFNGTFDTPAEAEAAIRKAIADKRATEKPADILQWQSGSDGKAYLGLEGVAGYDANESPVWGLSKMPFGAGWFVGGWGKKSDKDAGLPPAGTSRFDDEAQARKFAEDWLQDWLQRNPPKA